MPGEPRVLTGRVRRETNRGGSRRRVERRTSRRDGGHRQLFVPGFNQGVQQAAVPLPDPSSRAVLAGDSRAVDAGEHLFNAGSQF